MSADPSDPFTAFSFRVELWLPGASVPLCDAAFAECEGLELRFDVSSLREGADPGRQRLFSSAAPPGRLTLRRGMTSSMDLWQWCTKVARDRGPRADCVVVVLSPDGAAERARFVLRGCLPAKLRGPDLNAAAGGVAIEELELVGESLSVSFPGSDDGADTVPVATAELRELDPLFAREINARRSVRAHVDPDSVAVSFAKADPAVGGAGSAALAFDLWVAVATGPTRRQSPEPDIHHLTKAFAYFITPRSARGSRELTAPAVRFRWGTFTFDGYVDSLLQSFDLFAAEGQPERARLSFTMSRPWIDAPPG